LQALSVPLHSLATLLSITKWGITMAHHDQAKRTEQQRKRRNTLAGRMNSLLANARHHSKPRGHGAPALTLEDLMEMWKEQQGLCAYTGWTMDVMTGSPLVASLERKDSAIGYTVDNTLLVCWVANDAKGTLDHNRFVEMCRAVALMYPS